MEVRTTIGSTSLVLITGDITDEKVDVLGEAAEAGDRRLDRNLEAVGEIRIGQPKPVRVPAGSAVPEVRVDG